MVTLQDIGEQMKKIEDELMGFEKKANALKNVYLKLQGKRELLQQMKAEQAKTAEDDEQAEPEACTDPKKPVNPKV